jgi:hypothetical protein
VAQGIFSSMWIDFACCRGMRLWAHQRAMKTDEVYDRPLETFGAATFGVVCGWLMA